MSTKPNQLMWSAVRLLFTIIILLSLIFIVPAAHAQTVTVTLSIDSASVDNLGVVTVKVTRTCSEPVILGDPSMNSIGVTVRQPYKRIYTIFGGGQLSFLTGECNGATQYTIQAFADPGKFGPGIAYIFADTQVCDTGANCYIAGANLNTRIH
jgi:hypothetical protein